MIGLSLSRSEVHPDPICSGHDTFNVLAAQARVTAGVYEQSHRVCELHMLHMWHRLTAESRTMMNKPLAESVGYTVHPPHKHTCKQVRRHSLPVIVCFCVRLMISPGLPRCVVRLVSAPGRNKKRIVRVGEQLRPRAEGSGRRKGGI